MKKKLFAVLCVLIILSAFSPVLPLYISPMQDDSYDLSILGEDGQPWQGDKGWTVYTCTEGNITKLTPYRLRWLFRAGLSWADLLFFPPADRKA